MQKLITLHSFKMKKSWMNEWMLHTHTHTLSHLIYARILWEKALQAYMIHNEKVHTKWKRMRYYYMVVTSVARLGHSTSSRSKNWTPNLWPKPIFIIWKLWRFVVEGGPNWQERHLPNMKTRVWHVVKNSCAYGFGSSNKKHKTTCTIWNLKIHAKTILSTKGIKCTSKITRLFVSE